MNIWKNIFKKTSSHSRDCKLRSKEDWERGRGARRISNPNYTPSITRGRKVYKLRKR